MIKRLLTVSMLVSIASSLYARGTPLEANVADADCEESTAAVFPATSFELTKELTYYGPYTPPEDCSSPFEGPSFSCMDFCGLDQRIAINWVQFPISALFDSAGLSGNELWYTGELRPLVIGLNEGGAPATPVRCSAYHHSCCRGADSETPFQGPPCSAEDNGLVSEEYNFFPSTSTVLTLVSTNLNPTEQPLFELNPRWEWSPLSTIDQTIVNANLFPGEEDPGYTSAYINVTVDALTMPRSAADYTTLTHSIQLIAPACGFADGGTVTAKIVPIAVNLSVDGDSSNSLGNPDYTEETGEESGPGRYVPLNLDSDIDPEKPDFYVDPETKVVAGGEAEDDMMPLRVHLSPTADLRRTRLAFYFDSSKVRLWRKPGSSDRNYWPANVENGDEVRGDLILPASEFPMEVEHGDWDFDGGEEGTGAWESSGDNIKEYAAEELGFCHQGSINTVDLYMEGLAEGPISIVVFVDPDGRSGFTSTNPDHDQWMGAEWVAFDELVSRVGDVEMAVTAPDTGEEIDEDFVPTYPLNDLPLQLDISGLSERQFSSHFKFTPPSGVILSEEDVEISGAARTDDVSTAQTQIFLDLTSDASTEVTLPYSEVVTSHDGQSVSLEEREAESKVNFEGTIPEEGIVITDPPTAEGVQAYVQAYPGASLDLVANFTYTRNRLGGGTSQEPVDDDLEVVWTIERVESGSPMYPPNNAQLDSDLESYSTVTLNGSSQNKLFAGARNQLLLVTATCGSVTRSLYVIQRGLSNITLSHNVTPDGSGNAIVDAASAGAAVLITAEVKDAGGVPVPPGVPVDFLTSAGVFLDEEGDPCGRYVGVTGANGIATASLLLTYRDRYNGVKALTYGTDETIRLYASVNGWHAENSTIKVVTSDEVSLAVEHPVITIARATREVRDEFDPEILPVEIFRPSLNDVEVLPSPMPVYTEVTATGPAGDEIFVQIAELAADVAQYDETGVEDTVWSSTIVGAADIEYEGSGTLSVSETAFNGGFLVEVPADGSLVIPDSDETRLDHDLNLSFVVALSEAPTEEFTVVEKEGEYKIFADEDGDLWCQVGEPSIIGFSDTPTPIGKKIGTVPVVFEIVGKERTVVFRYYNPSTEETTEVSKSTTLLAPPIDYSHLRIGGPNQPWMAGQIILKSADVSSRFAMYDLDGVALAPTDGGYLLTLGPNGDVKFRIKADGVEFPALQRCGEGAVPPVPCGVPAIEMDRYMVFAKVIMTKASGIGRYSAESGIAVASSEFARVGAEVLVAIYNGEGEGATQFAGDMIAGMCFWGDTRDIVKQLAAFAGGGPDGVDKITLVFATAGLLADFGQFLFPPAGAGNFILSACKTVWKAIPGGSYKDDLASYILKQLKTLAEARSFAQLKMAAASIGEVLESARNYFEDLLLRFNSGVGDKLEELSNFFKKRGSNEKLIKFFEC